ncbi:MAG TPA: tetratricopeptide repeat protein [Candidatus Paceibacterota bacterium]
MDHSSGQPKFEIRPIIEQKPFENPAVQSFFEKWCEINDSIVPQIVNRETWEQRGVKDVLERRPDGKQTLYLPEDLQLWEMVGVMEVVDHDTFAAKPERQNEKKDELVALGKLFQNSGAYIAGRLNSIEQGKEIARALAEEFYEYGLSLENGKRPEQSPAPDDILSRNLTSQEINAVDRFLAGENLFKSRQARAETLGAVDPIKRGEFYESERQKTLAQFFRVAQKAFELKRRTKNDEIRDAAGDLKPWQSDTPIHSAFLAKIERAITKKIETPKQELMSAIFRRGLEKLVSEMRETEDMREKRTGKKIPGWKIALSEFLTKLNFNPLIEQKRLTKFLKIPRLKDELNKIRDTGNSDQISVKEREIADKIQKAVSSFPRQSVANNPAEMVANQYINCVGASILGGALMKEAGLRYLVGSVPEHSILFLATEDGRVEWRDMLNATFNEELTDEMIVGKTQDRSPLTVADIAAFSRDPKPEGLMFDIEGSKYREKLRWVKEGQRQFVTVFEPGHGQQIQVLSNTGNALYDLGRNEEAIEAYRQAVALNPKYTYPYNGLGYALRSLGRDKEAIEVYQKFIGLSDKQKDDYLIKRAEKIIAELHKK